MSAIPVCDDTRNDSRCLVTCPLCGVRFEPSGRSRYCTPRCRQRAHRFRHRPTDRATLADLTAALQRERRLVEHTVYECPVCQERFLGERRCGDCNRMCRKVGLGGRCSGCDDILTIADLLGLELRAGDAMV